MEEALHMGQRDINRHHVIRNILEGKSTQSKAALVLSLGTRQIQRLCARVRAEGARGVVHRLRGRPSNNRLDSALLERAANILQDPLWHDFGPTFARDKLAALHGIRLSAETLRQLMIRLGRWQARRPRARHRAWRERRACLGMLVQLDGSDHDWFEGRGPRCVLIIYIDDATSRILYGEFVNVEDTLTLMRTTKTYLKRLGRPAAFYVDKDSIYKVNRQATVEEELRDEQPMTQFTRAMGELGVEVIAADSPQAKGRVERGFDTHQDRLVKELRLAGISSKEAANTFLWEVYIPGHNASYAVAPASTADAHRPLLASHDLDAILSLRTQRVLHNDFTLRYRNRLFQVLPQQPVRLRPRTQVTVEERLDGSIQLLCQGRYLGFKPIAHRPLQPPAKAPREHAATPLPSRPYKPPKDHPWRRYALKQAPPLPPQIRALIAA